MHLMQITGATKPATFPKASLTLENSSDNLCQVIQRGFGVPTLIVVKIECKNYSKRFQVFHFLKKLKNCDNGRHNGQF